MISVGIDVSKEKSTVCILKPYGEIVMKPKDVQHTESELSKLVGELQELQEEIRVVMEAPHNAGPYLPGSRPVPGWHS